MGRVPGRLMCVGDCNSNHLRRARGGERIRTIVDRCAGCINIVKQKNGFTGQILRARKRAKYVFRPVFKIGQRALPVLFRVFSRVHPCQAEGQAAGRFLCPEVHFG